MYEIILGADNNGTFITRRQAATLYYSCVSIKRRRTTSPFVFLGEAEYVRHEGSKPMSIVWRLKEDMPPALVPAANKVIV